MEIKGKVTEIDMNHKAIKLNNEWYYSIDKINFDPTDTYDKYIKIKMNVESPTHFDTWERIKSQEVRKHLEELNRQRNDHNQFCFKEALTIIQMSGFKGSCNEIIDGADKVAKKISKLVK